METSCKMSFDSLIIKTAKKSHSLPSKPSKTSKTFPKTQMKNPYQSASLRMVFEKKKTSCHKKCSSDSDRKRISTNVQKR